MDFLTQCDIEDDIRRLETLLVNGILERPGEVFFRSALIDAVICLHDLLQKAKDFDVPIIFNEDVHTTRNIKNITDSVAMIRNALCHVSSKTHIFDMENNIKAAYNTFHRSTGKMMINGEETGSDYADDTCYQFGKHRLYLDRHVRRALKEAKESLTPLFM